MTETEIVLSEYLAVGLQSEFHPVMVAVLTAATKEGLYVAFEFKHEFGWTVGGAMLSRGHMNWQMIKQDLLIVSADLVQRLKNN